MIKYCTKFVSTHEVYSTLGPSAIPRMSRAQTLALWKVSGCSNQALYGVGRLLWTHLGTWIFYPIMKLAETSRKYCPDIHFETFDNDAQLKSDRVKFDYWYSDTGEVVLEVNPTPNGRETRR
jgi:hypothetical protein